jgi:hypothetical protein
MLSLQEEKTILLEIMEKYCPVYVELHWSGLLPKYPHPKGGFASAYSVYFNHIGCIELPPHHCRLWLQVDEYHYNWTEPMLIEDAKRYLDLTTFL